MTDKTLSKARGLNSLANPRDFKGASGRRPGSKAPSSPPQGPAAPAPPPPTDPAAAELSTGASVSPADTANRAAPPPARQPDATEPADTEPSAVAGVDLGSVEADMVAGAPPGPAILAVATPAGAQAGGRPPEGETAVAGSGLAVPNPPHPQPLPGAAAYVPAPPSAPPAAPAPGSAPAGGGPAFGSAAGQAPTGTAIRPGESGYVVAPAAPVAGRQRDVTPGPNRKRRELTVPTAIAEALERTGINPADVVMAGFRRHAELIYAGGGGRMQARGRTRLRLSISDAEFEELTRLGQSRGWNRSEVVAVLLAMELFPAGNPSTT